LGGIHMCFLGVYMVALTSLVLVSATSRHAGT
jgi:hypothetical protein